MGDKVVTLPIELLLIPSILLLIVGIAFIRKYLEAWHIVITYPVIAWLCVKYYDTNYSDQNVIANNTLIISSAVMFVIVTLLYIAKVSDDKHRARYN